MNCFKNGNECPYRQSCNDYLSDGSCSKLCTQIHELDLLFHNANIPKRFYQPLKLYPDDIDVESYEALSVIKNNIAQLVEDGFNLYIYSPLKLNGKTSWAVKILQNYFHYILAESGTRNRGLYVDVNEYLTLLKSNFDNPDKSIKDLDKALNNVDIVIWDNMDETRLSEWERGNIKTHIKKRLADNHSNIFVGSSINNELSIKIGEDLKAYVQDNSIVISLLGKRGDK